MILFFCMFSGIENVFSIYQINKNFINNSFGNIHKLLKNI